MAMEFGSSSTIGTATKNNHFCVIFSHITID